MLSTTSSVPTCRYQLVALGCLAVVGCLSPTLWGADPVLTSMQPYGFQRGTEVVTKLGGARLSDAQALLLYRPGIEVKELKATGDKEVEVKLAIAPNCPMGFHAMRIRTATGISNLQTVSVGALPEVAEAEPNSDFASPQLIDMNSTVNGVVTNEDVDYFAVEAKKGQRLSVELEGVRLGMPPNNNTFFDPFVAVLDAKRFEIARSDDTSLLQQDGLCSLVVPEDGTYVIEVRESSYRGSNLCKYRLHVGNFPRPTAVFPGGGRPGESMEVRWIGDAAGEFRSPVTIPTGEGPVHELFAEDDHGIAPSPLRIRVNNLANVLEAEPNDARDKAQTFAAPAALNGVIERPGDVDHFQFTAKKDQTYDVRVFARTTLRSPLDSVLSISRSNGAGVGGNDDSGGPDSYLRFKAPADDDYVIAVRDQLADGAPDFVYRVEVTPIERRLTLSLPERIRYKPMTVSVPRNNRFAMMVNAARENFGGELELTLENLPPGITCDPVKMAGNLSSVPVIFSATADGPLAGSLANLIGRSTDPNVPVTGQLKQRTMLVRGQNNRDVWGHDADRVSVALTDEAPFSIEVVQPKVPIVRNGSMQLKVMARRAEGFDEPIAIFMLYNPPGIGSSGSISIPKGKTEGTIPLTANGNARIGQWPLIVLGRSKVAGGDVEVASQEANLEIADVFFTFAFEKSAAELDQETDVLVRVEKKRDFPGTATAELLGLPAKTSLVDSKPLEFTKDDESLVFKIKVGADARPGKYQTLVCRATVTMQGEPIVQTLGSGELRVDKPLPPKADAPKPEQKQDAKPAAKEPPQKRLSRLEQLRLNRKKMDGGGQ